MSGIDTAAYVTVVPDPSVPAVGVAALAAHARGSAVPVIEPVPPAASRAASGAPYVPTLVGLRILEPRFPNLCATRNPWAWGAQEWRSEGAASPPRCFAVELDVAHSARVFLLRHNPDHRLLRLLPASCRVGGTLYHQAEVGQPLRVPRLHRGKPALRSVDGSGDTVYAIAVHDPVVARRLEADLRRLPGLCGGSERAFVDPRTADRWLDRLDAFIARHAGVLDWGAMGTTPMRSSGADGPLRLGRFSSGRPPEVR